MQEIGQSWATVADPTTKSRLVIRFEMLAKEDESASARENRPVYRDVEYIEKRVPGDKLSIIFRPITDADRKEYAGQYKAWKEGLADPTSGTPLKEWPPVSRSQVEHLAHNGIKTVEDLANLTDGNAQGVGAGTLMLRQKAQDWLARANGGGQEAALRAELSQRDTHIATLTRQVEALAARAKAQDDEAAGLVPATEAKRGPGRPRKEA